VAFLIPLPGWTPPERYPPENTPWTKAAILFNTTPDLATATVIEAAFTLSPAYTDPASPPTYSFTTDNAPAESGWFWIRWEDAAARQQPAGPVELRALSPYAPTVADVASRVRPLLREGGGVLVNTYTDQTVPSAAQVQMMIANDFPLLLMTVGSLSDTALTCADASELRAAVRAVAAERIALQVLEQYLVDEVSSSPMNLEPRWERVNAMLAQVEEAAAECRTGDVVPDVPDEDGGIGMAPKWLFPPAWPIGRL
jgi:hypothetical protein